MIDLQIHTVATPHHAFWRPNELAAAAKRANLSTIAATDHNTMGSVRELVEAGKHYSVRVISGVELDSGFGDKLWHTLVYGIAPENTALRQLCGQVHKRNLADAEALRTRLSSIGFQLNGLNHLDRPPNVADVGTVLAAENRLEGRVAGENNESAGMRFILTEVVGAYRPLGVDEIAQVAHAHGGTVVLAHPGRSKGIYAVPATEADITAMRAVGLDGIEVYYPAHSPEQQGFYREIAQSLGLLITAGSDSHGPSQPLAQWDEALCAEFLHVVNMP